MTCTIMANLLKGRGAKLKGLRLRKVSYDSLVTETGYFIYQLVKYRKENKSCKSG